MKNIYTLTFHNALNYGAMLQCYALSKFINNQKDMHCEVLDYLRSNWEKAWSIYWVHSTDLRDILRNIYNLLRPTYIRDKKKKNKIFSKFMSDYLPLTSVTCDSSDVSGKHPIGDCYIVGSDQVWNLNLRYDLSFFLNFINGSENTKKIAYAASIADSWTEEQAIELKPYLEDFDLIAIREKEQKELVQSVVSNQDVKVVCDPVFLLDQNQWNQIAAEPSIKEPYMLCYFLGVSDDTVKAVKRIREVSGLKIVYINVNALDKLHSDYNIRTAGPREFIGLIANAKLVCTNSFHASAFSIIFRKNFCYIAKSFANSRVRDLQSYFGLNDRFITPDSLSSLTNDDLLVDYSKCDELGDRYIEDSKKLLLDAIYD